MRARECVYHLACFTCDHCKRVLNTGDSFGMSGNKIYCHSDYQALVLKKQIKVAKKKGNSTGRQKKRKHDIADYEGKHKKAGLTEGKVEAWVIYITQRSVVW